MIGVKKVENIHHVEECLMESLENLLQGFQRDFISDLFFEKVTRYQIVFRTR